MISVEIRLISVIFVRWAVVGGCCVCVFLKEVCWGYVGGGGHPEKTRCIGDPW